MEINMEELASDDYRFEIKYQIPLQNKELILQKCIENKFIKEYPNRMIHSIYFDDFQNNALYDSLNGLYQRKKIRLRKYNSNSNGRLEEKIKTDQMNKKNIRIINQVPDFENYTSLFEFIRQEYPIKNLIPASRVSYLREYFINKESNVRITLDSQIRTKDFKTNIHKILLDSFILEIKSEKIPSILNLNFGIQTRFSKYCYSRQDE